MTQIMILKRDTIETLPCFLLEMGVCRSEGVVSALFCRPFLGHKSLYN